MPQDHRGPLQTNIETEVIQFLRNRLKGRTPFFRMHELTYIVRVMTQNHAAPESPGRILRALRARGRVGYRLVSRSGSLYEVTRA